MHGAKNFSHSNFSVNNVKILTNQHGRKHVASYHYKMRNRLTNTHSFYIWLMREVATKCLDITPHKTHCAKTFFSLHFKKNTFEKCDHALFGMLHKHKHFVAASALLILTISSYAYIKIKICFFFTPFCFVRITLT